MSSERGEWASIQLPDGWTWEPFGSVFDDVTDSNRKLPQNAYTESGAFPVIDQGEAFIGGYTDDRDLIHPNEPPFIIFGDHTRCVKYADFAFVQGADGVKTLKPRTKVDARYAYYALRTIALPDKGYSRHMKFLRVSSFPVCALSEQRRIAAKLDSLLTKTALAREQLEHVPQLVERYKQAVLAAAFRGDLTGDWREENNNSGTADGLHLELLDERRSAWDRNGGKRAYKRPMETYQVPIELPELPANWKYIPVEHLSTKVVDGVHKKPSYKPAGIPFLTVRNLTAGPGITFSNVRYVSTEDHADFSRRANPTIGDILITKDGTLGVTRAIRSAEVFSIFVSLALVKPIRYEMTDYLELAFQSPVVQGQMVGVGTGLQHIHLTDLKKDFVPVAPLAEQGVIVQRVQQAFLTIESAAREAARAASLLDRLDETTLARAFRGELIPQHLVARIGR